MERFTPKDHPLLPGCIESWTIALLAVDRSAPPRVRLGLWLPEAEFVVTPSNPLRLTMYLVNWLQARIPLLTLLNERRRYAPFGPNAWRSFLGRLSPVIGEQAQAPPAKSKKRSVTQLQKRSAEKDESFKAFSALLSRSQPFVVQLNPPAPSSLHWRGNIVQIKQGNDFAVPSDVVREIAWELSEVAFRVELAELDLRLLPPAGQQDLGSRDELLEKIFPDCRYTMPEIPPPRCGLGSLNVWDRLDSLEALRRLMSRWPKCPVHLLTPSQFIGQFKNHDLKEFEQRVCIFYCQTFFDTFGRAPALPHIFPS
jgi:hypothetical protein